MTDPEAVTNAESDVDDLLAARRRCEAARWSEHHDPNCAWCAFLVGGVHL